MAELLAGEERRKGMVSVLWLSGRDMRVVGCGPVAFLHPFRAFRAFFVRLTPPAPYYLFRESVFLPKTESEILSGDLAIGQIEADLELAASFKNIVISDRMSSTDRSELQDTR